MLTHFLPGYFVDADHPDVVAYAQQHTNFGQSDQEKAVRLYYAIRDGFYYNPYGIHIEKSKFKASEVATRSKETGGHCIDKATLLAACARACGIGSRLHFVNVKNHIGTEKLEKLLGTSTLVFHGYTELLLDGKWVAATPAFNKGLCEKLGVSPLEFDGLTDSPFQEYDKQGGKFMTYLHDYGVFDDIPFELMIGEWKRYYPAFVERLKKRATDLTD